MNKLKNNQEIIIGVILGIVFVMIGVFIVYHGNQIMNFKEIAVNKLHMVKFLDFINIYIYSFIKILSHYIHSFSIIYGLVFILYGLSFFYTSKTLKRTTLYDGSIALFYLMTALFLFIFTAVLMFEVYDWYALFYIVAYSALLFYVMNRRKLNEAYRKMHYIVLLFIFSVAYLITQSRIYTQLQDHSQTPLDVMALNFFFILFTSLGMLALFNYVFLYRAKKIPINDQKLSRMNKRKRDRQMSELISRQTNEAFSELSKQTLKFDERMVVVLAKFKKRVKDWVNVQDDDIPNWMRKPKWFSFFHIEILFGSLMLLLTLIELKNRSNLFFVSQFNVVKMQYFYEWINLFGMLVIILLYIFFTLLIRYKGRGYIGQLFTITFLFAKLFTSMYLLVFKGVNLALFIPPVVLFLFIMVTPLFLYHLKKKY